MRRAGLKVWIEAMRLRTLPVSVAGVVTACAYALQHGTFSAVPASLCLAFAVLAQIASNFANEYYDFRAGLDKAGRAGPRRGVTEGDITPKAMLHATYGTLLAAALIGCVLMIYGGWWLLFAGAAIGVGALAYSAGPYPLSRHCLGEVAVILFFGIVPVTLTYYVQALHWDWTVTVGGIGIGLIGANVLIVNNYRDIDDDRAVGKHTLAVHLGRKAMLALYALNAMAGVCFTLPLWARLPHGWLIVPALYLCAAAAIINAMARRDGAALNPLLGMTATSLLAYALLMLAATAL